MGLEPVIRSQYLRIQNEGAFKDVGKQAIGLEYNWTIVGGTWKSFLSLHAHADDVECKDVEMENGWLKD